MKRVLPVLALIVVAGIGILWYSHRTKQRALGNGEVHVRNQGSPAPDTSSDPTTAGVSAASPEEMASVASEPVHLPTKPSAATLRGASATVIPATARTLPMTQPQGAVAVPASDTIPRNPPSGMIFAGSGKYQLYRQGDITWRLNTDTGQACIIFATDTQWSKPRIYSAGCGAS